MSGDNVPPTVSITSPVNGALVARKSTVTITATANDNVGVTRVEFLVNGALQCTDVSTPYSCNWRVPGAANKNYQLEARAFDQAGNTATSATVRSGRVKFDRSRGAYFKTAAWALRFTRCQRWKVLMVSLGITRTNAVLK